MTNTALDIRDPQNYPYPQNLGMVMQKYIDQTNQAIKEVMPFCGECGSPMKVHTMLYIQCSKFCSPPIGVNSIMTTA